MKGLQDYLKKFEVIAPPDDAVRKAVVKAIADSMGVMLTKSKVRMQGTTAFISASSLILNQIRQHRKEIIDAVHQAMPKSVNLLRDIR